ncbi:hypothetical protein CQW39_09770 [Streptomyces griseofuscus]|uniref:DUF6415 family natural product biosynthesis protein n=1 Tax=Streptomyces griseofuscus TaxID=146922 RepID=UPI000F6469DE|nr:DUF6415 family natural product biosynthesis protein [Streptomyces griseofuscus]RRQ79417.1 hypothetical protein CQW39_09770 [Streptomyces griseofuscus]
MTAEVSAERPTDPIPALIEAAFEATRLQPTPERMIEIDRGLRNEVGRLSTTARALAEHRPHRSPGWYALVTAVDRADDALTFQNREGLAGALNVAELARRVIELRQKVTPS